VASWWIRSGLTWDPREPSLPLPSGPSDDPLAHLNWALQLSFDSVFPVLLNPCLRWCYSTQSFLGPTLSQVRQQVCDDLQELVSDTEADQAVDE
jgi:hypothetical protein